jgi:hypothetical protein
VARYSNPTPAILNALRPLLNMDPNDVSRVVIDIQAGRIPVVHIERFVDDSVIDVLRTLDGIEIERKES